MLTKGSVKIGLICIFMIIVLLSISNREKIFIHSYPAYKNLYYNRLSSKIIDYETKAEKEIIIRYSKDDNIIVDYMMEIAQRDYEKIGEFFGFYPGAVTIVLHGDYDSMTEKIPLPANKSTIGVYYGGVVSILSPQYWMEDISPESLRRKYEEQELILHELTHFMVDMIAKGNFPLWFTEGIALYLEYEILGYEWGKGIERANISYNRHELTYRFNSLDDTYAYRMSFLIVKKIIDEHGKEKLMVLLQELGRGINFDKAIKDVLKVDIDYFFNS